MTSDEERALAEKEFQAIIDKAVEVKADSITVEFAQGGGLEVMFESRGAGDIGTGIGGILVDQSLESAVMGLIYERSGLKAEEEEWDEDSEWEMMDEEKKYSINWQSHGRALNIYVEEYESFGETGFRLILPK